MTRHIGLIILLAAAWMGGEARAAIPVELIRNFNTALEAGENPAVIGAAEALIEAALNNPDDPQAVDVAFEAGTQLCLRGACPRASAAGPLMAGANTEHVSPALANLLVAYSQWSQKQDRTTDAAMFSALQAVAGEGATLLTISAFDRYHLHKLQAGNPSDIRKVAELAAAHYQPVSNLIPINWATMELSATAASFARDRTTDTIDRLAKPEVALYPYNLEGHSRNPELVDIYYQTLAWRFAVEAFFKSRGPRTAGLLAAADAYVSVETQRIADEYYIGRKRLTPACTGGLVRQPTPSYPSSALQRGYVGAVVVGFDIHEGEIENVRVLAAVPDRQFEVAVLDAMKRAKWYFDEVQEQPNCRRTRTGRPAIIPFMFVRGQP